MPKKAVAKKAATPVKKVKKEKKQKRDGPKRPMTAYFFYANEIRDKVTAEIKKVNPGAKVTDVAKEIGSKWRSLTENAKAKYQALARNDKLRYQAEKDASA
ncbi:MAG: hypothetical protein KVP17_000831 [Porospora cf. gigantea B]|uniref:uncharacterized protein n=1 Tax=Porospora cf. gigantea B TaxID=2853592 RepID=UPI003571CCAB|nr:MAG: hypothetical protein KVP17_000831 [Porospora cf. gigantea B]